jgi:phage terminase Nu1 subunit (DNA packaging protein)
MKPLPDEITTAQLAFLVGLTPARISQLVMEGTIARNGRNRFSIAVVPTIVKALRDRSEGGPKTFTEARAKLVKEKARLAELERLTKEGELVSTRDLEPAWLLAYSNLRQKLLGLPASVGASWGMVTSAAKATELVRKKLYAILDEYAAMPVVIAGAVPEDLIDETEETDECVPTSTMPSAPAPPGSPPSA